MRCARLLSLVSLAAGLLALAASAPVTSADAEANRRLLQEIRATDPEHFARLRDSFDRFQAMTPRRRDQLRQLDRELHQLDASKQAHLTRVLGDYAAWITRLSPADRDRVQQAGSAQERLKVIRDIRHQQWLAGLPQVLREEYRAAPDNRKPELLAKWCKEEQKRDQEWASARQQWQAGDRPAPVNQEEFRHFVQTKLRPMLSQEEKDRLTEAQQSWLKGNRGQYMQMVVALSDKHPVLSLDGQPQYLTFDKLPDEYKKAIQKLPKDAIQRLRNSPNSSRWPAYAVEVIDVLRRYDLAPKKQLGPSTAAEFNAEIKQFVQGLPPTEREQLESVEGKWPEYPKMMHELAHRHHVALPGLSLPGDPRHWDQVRRGRGMGSLP